MVNQWPGPLLVHAEGNDSLSAWVSGRRPWIDEALIANGAILFSGFKIDNRAAFQQAAAALCDELLDYVYRSTPRSSMGDGIYTATEYRASDRIHFHNENSYQRDWPMKLVFCCLRPATTGGETGLASSSRVTRRIDPDVLARFDAKGVMYVRNYRAGLDLTWQETFQTQRPEDVEAFCRRESIEWEWVAPDHLRTRQVCQALARHPITGERLWFNQSHLFHMSALGEATVSALLELFSEADLPRNAYFGDGSPIDTATVEHIRQAYDAEAFIRPWSAGEVVLVDNMLVAHARSPYQGVREVLVAMGESHAKLSEVRV